MVALHFFGTALLLAAAVVAGPASRPASPAHASGPTLATEDTMHTEVAPVLVSAPRVTLDEILGRVARGEHRRDSLMTDQSYLVTMRLVRNADPKRPAEVLMEEVSRVYKKKPDLVRTQLLRRYEAHADTERGAKVEVRVSQRGGMDERIVNSAFRPEARREYRYHILGRTLLGDHLVYRIGFEPRSLLDPSKPRGIVWIDTNDFVIVREELIFDRSPLWLVKGINRFVIERQNVDGYWVLKRGLLRMEAAIPLPEVGRSFDFAIQFDHYAINRGLPDTLFAGRAEVKR
jgi:hypothetical protein